MYERFTAGARHAMQAANRAAIRSNCDYISTEHILLGLLEDASCGAVRLLEYKGLSPARLRPLVEASVTPPDSPGAAKRAVESAIEEAHAIGSWEIGTQHLLLGVLCAMDSAASRILSDAGLPLSAAQNAVREMSAAHLLTEVEAADSDPAVSGTSERTRASIPIACPKCGASSIVRILWSSMCYCHSGSKAQIEAGRAIAAGERSGSDLPAWACVRCAPDWTNVQQLSLQIEELQVAKEEAVAARDFERAASLRDAQDRLRHERADLSERLLGRQEPS